MELVSEWVSNLSTSSVPESTAVVPVYELLVAPTMASVPPPVRARPAVPERPPPRSSVPPAETETVPPPRTVLRLSDDVPEV